MKAKEISIENIWNNTKIADIKKSIKSHFAVQSNEVKLSTKLLAIQYSIEDYIENDDDIEVLKVLDFVKMYLKLLSLTKKDLANYFEMKDSNLHKYLSGERKLNAKLVLKLSTFSRTKPEQWYRIEVKNELIALKKEQANADYYKKYDYQNLVDF